MKLFKYLKFGFLFFLISHLATATPADIRKGWQLFNTNQREEAKKVFITASQSLDDKAEASLALALIYWSENNADKAFNYFNEFIKVAPNPDPYLYALWTTPVILNGFNGSRKSAQVAFIQSLLTQPHLHGTLRAMCHAALGDHYENNNRYKEANEEFSQIGAVGKWQVLGTFDNISGNGFNKDVGALLHPEATAQFTHRFGAPIKWYSVPAERADKWFDFTYYFDVDNSVMYAQSWINSPTEQHVVLRSGCSGSIKIWLNDQLVLAEPEERNCDLDIYASPILLQKGYNRILVQIGESEVGRANFMIRLTDHKGVPAPNLTWTDRAQLYTKATGDTPKSEPFFAEEYFKQQIAQVPDQLVNYLLLAEVYLRNDKKYEARQILQQASRLAPESSFVKLRQIEAFNRDGNRTEASKALEWVKDKDSNNYFAIDARLKEAGKKENWDEMEKELGQLKSLYGTTQTSELYEIELLAKRNKVSELLKKASEYYAKYPDNKEAISLQYLIETKVNRNPKRGNELLSKALQQNYVEEFMTELANNYLQQGDKKSALKLFEQRLEDYPYAVGYFNQMADLCAKVKDYESAIKYQLKTIEFSPYLGGYWQSIANLYEYKNEPEKAKVAYRNAILYRPNSFDAHKALRRLSGKKDLFEEFSSVNADELYRKSPVATAFPDDNSIVLLNETQRIVYPQGATIERKEIVAKMFTQAGIDLWKAYEIPYYPATQRLIIEKIETLKTDGSRVVAESNENKVIFTNLQPNDAIHILYRVENIALSSLHGNFSDQFQMNLGIPVKNARYSLLFPADKKFRYEVRNTKLEPKIEAIDGYKKYVWELSDLPALRGENYMPVLADIGISLKISTFSDWNAVSRWYANLAANKARSDFEVKEAVATLLKKSKATTNLQKAKEIYGYILDNIIYSSVDFRQSGLIPQTASKTISTKLGDCKDMATLFVAMCQEAGLKANLVLVDTRDNGDYHLTIPSIDFNHCIARFQDKDDVYFVELTNPYLSFGTLPTTLLHTNALVIPALDENTASELTKLNSTSRVLNQLIRETTISAENKDMLVSTKNVRTGELASDNRAANINMSNEAREKNLKEAIANDFTNTVKLIDFNFGDLNARSDTLRTAYSYRVSKEFTEVAGITIVKLPWQEGIRSLDFLAEEKRLFPVEEAAKKARVNGYDGLKTPIPEDWSLHVESPGKQPLTLSIDDIKALPKHEIVYEFKCIEGWSQVQHWGGARLSDFMEKYKVGTHSGNVISADNTDDLYKYVGLETPDKGYYVGIDMESALHPQTLLAYELNGEPITAPHGAPLRLIIPVKYGVKNLKRIGRLFFADDRPRDFWAERGYDYYVGL